MTFPTLKLFRELPLSGEAARRQEERRCGAMRAGSAGTPGAIGPLRSVCPGAPGPRKPAGSAQPRTAPHRTARGAAASIPSAGLGPGVGRPGRPARGCAPAATPARTASGGAGPRLGARSPETRAGTGTPAAAAPVKTCGCERPPTCLPTCRREKRAVPGCSTREPQRWHSTAFRFRPSADTKSFSGSAGSIAATATAPSATAAQALSLRDLSELRWRGFPRRGGERAATPALRRRPLPSLGILLRKRPIHRLT